MYGVVVAATAQIWGSGAKAAPRVFPEGGIGIASVTLRWGQLGLFFVALATAAGFYALFRFTGIGLAMRGAAENPRAAGLMGINPERMARLAWLLGGGLAGLAGILLAAVTNLQPYSLSLQMLPAFVAALIGGFGSLPGAVTGAAIVGVAQGIVPAFNVVPGVRGLATQVGMPQLVLTILALGAMYLRGGRFSVGDSRAALAGDAEATPVHTAFNPLVLPRRGGRKRLTRYVVLFVLLVWPFLGVPGFLPLDTFSLLGDSILAAEYFIAASSIVMLTGWVGQISLSQAAFVGIGAFGSALLTRRFGLDFPVTLLFGAGLSAAASALLGVVALRVRGLYLAVATLIFAWMADEYLFIVPWFAGKGGSTSAKSEPVGLGDGGFPYFDFTERRTFYFVVLAAAAAVLFGLLNVRDSKAGRAFFAVRGSEMAAASLGIDVVRYKLLAFASAGFVAGLAGTLVITHQVTVVPEQFSLRASLLFLAIAVVGGLRSLGGTVAASIVFAALSELFFRVPALGEYLQLVSALLLALILLVYPGGLAALPKTVARLRRRVDTWLASERAEPLVGRARAWAQRMREGAEATEDLLAERGRRVRGLVARALRTAPLPSRLRGPQSVEADERRLTGLVVPLDEIDREIEAAKRSSDEAPVMAHSNGNGNGDGRAAHPVRPASDLHLRDSFRARGPVVRAEHVTVRFGGLTAVSDASLEVRAGQIVGLIGPNGAGKTTLFNAVSGLNSPASGRIELFGEDVTDLPVHQRAARGLGRTFQVIQLFPELTVFENLLVATHLHNPSNLLSNLVVTGKSVRGELAAEETCRQVVRFLGLEAIADRPVAGLPFGILRMIEIGRALVTGAPALMLDEPASGLDNTETDKLSELLLFVRSELNLSILLIEHDVKMVTGVSDYMYVLNRGEMLAQGKPAEVQRNPAVVAAYLGEPAVEAVV